MGARFSDATLISVRHERRYDRAVDLSRVGEPCAILLLGTICGDVFYTWLSTARGAASS